MPAARHGKLFLYQTRLGLVVTQDNVTVSNLPMYQRTVVAHRGLNNDILFDVTNRDRQAQNVSNTTVQAVLVDPRSKKRFLTKSMVPTATAGQLKLTLDSGDLRNVRPGRYHMFVKYLSASGEPYPFYANQDNGVRFDIEVTDQALQEPLPTQTQDTFTPVAGKWVTSALSGNQARNFDGALHCVAIYLDEYVGRLTIQGSCNAEAPGNSPNAPGWFDIHSEEVFYAETGILYRSFVVNANWIRIVDDRAFGKPVKVMLRN
jgi:hypothetical protein